MRSALSGLKRDFDEDAAYIKNVIIGPGIIEVFARNWPAEEVDKGAARTQIDMQVRKSHHSRDYLLERPNFSHPQLWIISGITHLRPAFIAQIGSTGEGKIVASQVQLFDDDDGVVLGFSEAIPRSRKTPRLSFSGRKFNLSHKLVEC